MKKPKSISKSKPLRIGVTFDFSERHGFFLKEDVVIALKRKNIEIVPLINDGASLKRIVQGLAGLLIPGGLGDVDPALYGQKKKHSSVQILRKRCDFEFEVLEVHLKTQKPILCICWGFQILNVFLGGSLIQDIPSDRPSDIQHQQTQAKHIPTHWVDFLPDTYARKLFKSERLFVNSTHHQGVDKIASSLSPEGYSSDGLLESFVIRKHPYGLGVQWHPERLVNDPVIPSFLKACRRLRP